MDDSVWAVPAEPEEAAPERSEIVCAACGERNSTRARFCQRCGAPTGIEPAGPELETTFAELEPQPEPELEPQPVPEPGFDDSPQPAPRSADEAPYTWPPVQPASEAGAPAAAPIVTAIVCEASPPFQEADWEGGSELLDAADALEEMASVLGEIRAVLERHGGAVDNLAGSPNTLVAVFGPEPPDGDGPLRAIRAAAEIRNVVPVPPPGADGEPVRAVLVRSGVGASEVMGPGHQAAKLWEQRVVDLAVRLQRMAEPGEVIVGEGVYRRIGDMATVQPVDGRASMDGGQPVGPLRLLDVHAEAPTVALRDAPPVGRDREVAALREAFRRVDAERTCSLVWVTGEAGIGKSRTVEEFLGGLEEEVSARVLRIRCRPPSEGGTMWPVADLVEQAAWVSDDDPPDDVLAKLQRLAGEGDGTRVVERLRVALGLGGGLAVAEETPWALRRLLELASPNAPLVLFVDDADRAGPAFAAVLKDMAARSREIPILIICAAREDPEPLGRRDEQDGSRIHVEPLAEVEIASLVADLLGTAQIEPDVLDGIVPGAEGNPLLAEQLVGLLIDQGRLRKEHGRWTLGPDPDDAAPPEGVPGVLDARLYALDPDQRASLGVTAVVGERFAWPLISELVPEETRPIVRGHLDALVSKHLLRADPGEVFAFRHALIRGRALADMPDLVSADVHVRTARWLHGAAGERPERSAEVIGAHLESASRLRRKAGVPDDDGEVGRRAAGMLAAAGTAAASLGDARGAVQLWLRASALLSPEDPVQPELLLETALALAALGEAPIAEGLLTQAARAARSSDARAVEWRTRLVKARLGFGAAAEADPLEALRETTDASIAAFRELGDDVGLSWAWSARVRIRRHRGHFAAAANAAERAAEHARRAGRGRDEIEALREVARASVDGPAPVGDLVQRCEAVLERVRGQRPAEQEVAGALAVLLARRGEVDRARELVAGAVEELEALGLERELVSALHRSGRIEAAAGEVETANGLLRRALDTADRLDDAPACAAVAASLAQVAPDLLDLQSALQLTELAERGAIEDVETRVRWRAARARVLSRGGQAEEAQALARQAVQLADRTDLIDLRAAALLDLAEVLRTTGRSNEAAPFARKALRTLERKGAVTPAARARALVEQIESRPSERAPEPATP